MVLKDRSMVEALNGLMRSIIRLSVLNKTPGRSVDAERSYQLVLDNNLTLHIQINVL